jgi:hypothetical protein
MVALRLPVAVFSSRRVSAHFTGRADRLASSAPMYV